MSVAESTMRPVNDPFADAADGAMMFLTPSLARRLIEDMRYSGQRHVRRPRVEQLVAEMQAGRFKKSVIDIGVCGTTVVLLNGQHRAHAVIASGVSIPVVVVYRRVERIEDLAAEYAVLDNPLIRSHADNLPAYALDQRFGLQPKVIERASACAPIIAAGFSIFPGANIHMSITPNRAAFLEEWHSAIAAAADTLGPANGALSRRFWGASTLSCALVTFRYQSEAASVFWGRATENDGLHKGDPEHTLVNNVMVQRPHGSGAQRTTQNRYTRAVAVCWNAAFEGRSVTLVKVPQPNAPIKFLGTPYDGTRHIRPYTADEDDS